ncbi:MAG: NfeD family protein [Candidatus Brocadiaceae bacterium]|jgi:membrane-bound serine protease (ClpP class)
MEGGELWIIIGLYLCGLLAMVVELFIPGMVLGVFGFMAVLGSIIYAIAVGRRGWAAVLIVCALAFVPAFFALWKNVVGRYFAISGDQRDYRPSSTIDEKLVGVQGVAVTALRPTGIARLNERRYDVVTRGELLEKGTPIEVIEVSGNRIVVKEA